MGRGGAGEPVTSSNVAYILAAILDFTKIENLTGQGENWRFFC